MQKQGKAELWGPASLLRCRPHARSGRSVGAAGPFGPLATRFAPWLPIKPAARPDHGPYLASRCYDVAPALARLEPASGGIRGAKDPVGPASRYCGDTARPWYSASTFPAAFSRPWHWTTSGLPCPREPFDHFPVLSDFSAGTFHNRPTHDLKDTTTCLARIRRLAIIPDIHRGEQNRGLRAALVDIDNVEASRRAVEFLIQQGHKRIVHFAGPTYSMHSEERADGVQRAFSHSSLVFPDEAIVAAGAHPEDGYQTGLRYFRNRTGRDRPTAVTCYNDLVALGLIRALRELGLSVPGDISVIGFDNLSILPYVGVPLTTVNVPKVEMGRRAAEMLIRRIESDRALPPERVTFEGELVVRDSTRPLSTGEGEA